MIMTRCEPVQQFLAIDFDGNKIFQHSFLLKDDKNKLEVLLEVADIQIRNSLFLTLWVGLDKKPKLCKIFDVSDQR